MAPSPSRGIRARSAATATEEASVKSRIACQRTAAAAELAQLGIRVVKLEITDKASVDRAAAEILAAGPVDVLVNNAGAAYFGVVEAFRMRERRSGLVLYVTSVVGRYTFPFGGVYASSKWALEALAESSSYELAPLGVDVAIVKPAADETNIGNSRVNADEEQRLSSGTRSLRTAVPSESAITAINEAVAPPPGAAGLIEIVGISGELHPLSE